MNKDKGVSLPWTFSRAKGLYFRVRKSVFYGGVLNRSRGLEFVGRLGGLDRRTSERKLLVEEVICANVCAV